MADVASVKAEIKRWEREFREINGKDPQVQDIKDNAPIGAASSSKAPATPSSRLLPKAREAETTAPLTSFNPFSPQKNRTIHQTSPTATRKPFPNPFATPSRPRTKTRSFTPELSPQPPSPLPNAKGIAQTLFSGTSVVNVPSAVSRARKRLRGEAVSPSPVKQKRQRLVSDEPPPSFSTDDNTMVDDDEDDVFTDAGNSSFVDDSPVKGGSFKLLFSDATTAKATSKPLFPPPAPSSDRLRSNSKDTEHEDGRRSSKGPPRVKSERLFSNIFPAASQTRQPRSGSRQENTYREVTAPQTSRKRALSLSDEEPSEEGPRTSVPVLVPPSPPPPDTLKRPVGPHKGKGKGATNDRKKAKLFIPDSDNEDDDDDQVNDIQVIVHTRTRSPHAEHSSDGDDMLLPHSKRTQDDILGPIESDRFEVDLPDKLRQVLAFSPNDSKARVHEGRMLDGLLYGRRTEHYDASKGGEIWDVGEDESEQMSDEEDWEGEPIPWQAGEL
ncbi:hypothetical protein BDZ89DRAFT_1060517 [Hymenopellis radicata]|nr:hypothetical protein BDZ89DRAFT_1060517 [Hymenopellis radicata]